jgi:hypothetical protein
MRRERTLRTYSARCHRSPYQYPVLLQRSSTPSPQRRWNTSSSKVTGFCMYSFFFFLRAGFFANEFSAVADSVQSVRPRLLPNYTPRACTLGRSPPMTSLFPCPSFLIRFAASNVGGNGRGAARTLGDVGRVSRTHHQGLLLPFFAVYSYIFSNLLTLCL